MGDEQGTKVQKRSIPVLVNFLIGGVSGMLSICIVQPMDLLKTRMQLMGPAEKDTSVFTVVGNIIKREGFSGFYTGLSAAIFRQATYTTGRLGCFNAMFNWHMRTYGVPNFMTKMAMGMTAGGVGALIGTPAEMVLIRMTADGRLPPDKRRNYKNVFNALSRITREEGITTLWRGVSATITRAMVFNGAQLSTYSQCREYLLPLLGDNVMLHLVSAMTSSMVTTIAAQPVDIVKTRVQNAAKGRNQVAVFRSIIKNEGFMALWSGFLPSYGKTGPHTVLTFIFFEQINYLYLNYT